MDEKLKLMEIAKDLTVATLSAKNYQPEDLRNKKSDGTISLFKKMCAAVKEQAATW